MTQPDSDAREELLRQMECVSPEAAKEAAEIRAHLSGYVTLPLPLAQRILAALEGEAAFLHNEGKESGSRMLYDVASELRAVIGK